MQKDVGLVTEPNKELGKVPPRLKRSTSPSHFDSIPYSFVIQSATF